MESISEIERTFGATKTYIEAFFSFCAIQCNAMQSIKIQYNSSQFN